jgi:hypothetical protein
MIGGPSVALLRDIQTLFDAGTVAGLSDRQLLERFTSARDGSSEAAFEVLVRRHGPMACASAATCSRTGTMPRTPSRRPS